MTTHSPILTKSFRAPAAIAGYLIAAATGVGNAVRVANSPTDALIAAVDAMGAPAGGMADIDVVGISSVRFGDDVAFDDPLTSDAEGRAVKAEPIEGEIVRIIGFAMCDAGEDDVGTYWVAPGLIATPEPGGP